VFSYAHSILHVMLTPQEEVPSLAKALGLNVPLYLKREDLHPYGSHKGRSIPYMIEQFAKGGETRFAISSSGNAAIAALMYVNEYNDRFTESPLSLQIFVGENIESSKYQTLKQLKRSNDSRISITQTDRPKQSVHKLNKSGEAKALRQSDDPLALVGYQSLVDELSGIENIGAIFVPTSSGTTAEALASKFPVHTVQTSACHPIAELFDARSRTIEVEASIADAIVDRVAIRKQELAPKLAGGWIVSDQEIQIAITLVKKELNLEISPNAALSVAGLMRAVKSGWKGGDPIVCLITGK